MTRENDAAICPECGAPVPEGGTCHDHFDALLALEWQIPGGAGELAHFYAVASYVLQHPDTMRYTSGSLLWLRDAVRRALESGATAGDLRQAARSRSRDGGTVTRREGEPVHSWGVGSWDMNVIDILTGGTDGYCERVQEWARAVLVQTGGGDRAIGGDS